MAIDERSRYQLFQKLEATLGLEEATTLMDSLPPTGWADVATKTDIDHLRALTKADIDQLRALTKADIDQLRALTKADIDEFRHDFGRDLAALELRMERSVRDNVRSALYLNLGTMTALVAVVIAAIKL
jgi:hypothetical protein